MKALLSFLILFIALPAWANDSLVKITQNETLNYNFTITGDITGTGTVAYYLYPGTYDGFDEALKIISDINYGDVSTSTEKRYYYDNSGNLYHYKDVTNDSYPNTIDNMAGFLVFPAQLSAGFSWTNDFKEIVFDGETFIGASTYTIVTKESVSVPYGTIEAYKTNVTSAYVESSNPNGAATLMITGTEWLHPVLYEIKSVAHVSYYDLTWTETQELQSTTLNFEASDDDDDSAPTSSGGGGGGGCFLQSIRF